MLEAEDDTDSDNHHCHADGYAKGGNAYSRTADLTASVLSPIDATCYE
jgi:hypothetical protein